MPAYSGAKDVLAVLEYEDVNRQRLRLLWVWYSVDGGATWARTEEGSGPADPIENFEGVVRVDGRLVMHGLDNAGLIVMDGDWSYFEPAAWTPGDSGGFELINAYGWGNSLTVLDARLTARTCTSPPRRVTIGHRSRRADAHEPLRVDSR